MDHYKKLIAGVGLTLGATLGAQAGTTDLTGAGSSATINGAIYTQVVSQPTGTGVFDPFLRLQQQGNNTEEAAYNSDNVTTDNPDAKTDIHTHSLQLSSLQEEGGYYTFTLDLGEPGQTGSEQSLLALSELKLYLGTAGDLAPTIANVDTLGKLVYNLDATEDNTVVLADLTSGNGKSDYTVQILKSAFDAQADAGHQFVYLFSHFGPDPSADGSFEEWAASTAPSTAVPLAQDAYMGLATFGLIGLAGMRRKVKGLLA
jgi:hypothetical protein